MSHQILARSQASALRGSGGGDDAVLEAGTVTPSGAPLPTLAAIDSTDGEVEVEVEVEVPPHPPLPAQPQPQSPLGLVLGVGTGARRMGTDSSTRRIVSVLNVGGLMGAGAVKGCVGITASD